MPAEAGRSGEAARERALGMICTRSYEHGRALEHFTRAAELDPEQAGEAQLGRALVLFETRREDELARLLDSLAQPAAPRVGAPTPFSLDILRALSCTPAANHPQPQEPL